MVNLVMKGARAMQGLSQLELARLCGRSQQWISKIERRLLNPAMFDKVLISRALKTQPDVLFPENASFAAAHAAAIRGEDWRD